MFCANVGDSRAVLARNIEGQICGFPLNRDHKANEPDEEERILKSGGRIEAFRDQQGRPMGPARVWHMHENIPGLAMSRSFGDQEVKGILKVLNNTKFEMHKRGKYAEARWYWDKTVKESFGEYLHWYLTTMTYPYNAPIRGCWSHKYEANGHMMGMHQDKYADSDNPNYEKNEYWTTTCLIEKSEDLSGGEIVKNNIQNNVDIFVHDNLFQVHWDLI